MESVICPGCGHTVNKASKSRPLYGALLIIPLLATRSILQAYIDSKLLSQVDELFSASSPPSLRCCKTCHGCAKKALEIAKHRHPMRLVFAQRFSRPVLVPWSSCTSSALVSASGDTLRTIYKKVAEGSIELKFESDDRRQTAETVGC